MLDRLSQNIIITTKVSTNEHNTTWLLFVTWSVLELSAITFSSSKDKAKALVLSITSSLLGQDQYDIWRVKLDDVSIGKLNAIAKASYL